MHLKERARREDAPERAGSEDAPEGAGSERAHREVMQKAALWRDDFLRVRTTLGSNEHPTSTISGKNESVLGTPSGSRFL